MFQPCLQEWDRSVITGKRGNTKREEGGESSFTSPKRGEGGRKSFSHAERRSFKSFKVVLTRDT